MNMRKLMTCALLAVALAALGAAHAQARTYVYPGSSCVRTAGPTPAFSYSRIFNPGTDILYLDCPIAAVQSVRGHNVDVIDQNYVNDNVSRYSQVCVELVGVLQRYYSTVYIASTGMQCTRGASSGGNRISMGSFPLKGGAGVSDYFYYSVSIPPTFNGQRSAIISYRVQQ